MNRPCLAVLLILAATSACACASAPAADPPATAAEASAGEPTHHDAHTDMHDPDDHQGHHDKRFTDAEAWAARFDDPERDAWQKPAEVTAILALEPGMTVADIGAGTGYFLSHLSAAVGDTGQVLALDVEQDMVDWMTERAAREGWDHVYPKVVSGDDPGLDPDSVDRILIVNTWHHIPERAAYSQRLAEALRPDGAVVVVDYTTDSPTGPPPEHRLPPEVVVDELATAGLDARVVDETLPNQYIVVATRPQP